MVSAEGRRRAFRAIQELRNVVNTDFAKCQVSNYPTEGAVFSVALLK
jgi:hypothetical protein